MLHYDKAIRLAETLYTMDPSFRLAFMSDLIKLARDGERKLRNILTDPVFLGARPSDEGLFFRRSPASYRTIAQAADAFCRRFWGAGVKSVVTGECPEPPSGEEGDTDGHAPSSPAPKRKTPRRPEGWHFRETPAPTCKGFRWLAVGKSETRQLRALGGCPEKIPPHM